MIDVQPFHDNLDKLAQYIKYWIEFFDAHRKELDFVYKIYKETGNILCRGEFYSLYTFEEFCNEPTYAYVGNGIIWD